MPGRQVHLDFHTSDLIPRVGTRFDKRKFQEALRLGRVNLINIFAKRHHSWSYYPTRVGRMHPSLTFDLLGQQIEACHEVGVRAPIYYTVGWSATDAEAHPEWCVRNADGSIAASHWDATAGPEDPRPATSRQRGVGGHPRVLLQPHVWPLLLASEHALPPGGRRPPRGATYRERRALAPRPGAAVPRPRSTAAPGPTLARCGSFASSQ